MKNNFRWIYFISKRISKVDRNGRTAVSSKLASLGVCFGVMALIVVMSVMNGFQRSFIDAIMEISSYHTRVSGLQENQFAEFEDFCKSQKFVRNFTAFYEAQGLMTDTKYLSEQSPVLLRAVPQNICDDESFKKELNVFSGKFDLSEENSIIIGNTIARNLGVRVGQKVNIAALSGSSDVSLLSQNRIFTVKGIFYSGYADINSSYVFINLDEAQKYFGQSAQRIYGIKFNHSRQDGIFENFVKNQFPNAKCVSFREFNKSFFGALRMEKNILFLVVLLIFVVVSVNIYNGMKKLVFERKTEIAVLKSFGATNSEIQNVFIVQGFLTGVSGAIPGLLIGLFLSVNMDFVFNLMSKIQYYSQVVITYIFNPKNIYYVRENPMFEAYARIPSKIFPSEVILIFIFGILSALVASAIASRDVLKMSVVEVLRDE